MSAKITFSRAYLTRSGRGDIWDSMATYNSVYAATLEVVPLPGLVEHTPDSMARTAQWTRGRRDGILGLLGDKALDAELKERVGNRLLCPEWSWELSVTAMRLSARFLQEIVGESDGEEFTDAVPDAFATVILIVSDFYRSARETLARLPDSLGGYERLR